MVAVVGEEEDGRTDGRLASVESYYWRKYEAYSYFLCTSVRLASRWEEDGTALSSQIWDIKCPVLGMLRNGY